jgi:hypothetical protein
LAQSISARNVVGFFLLALSWTVAACAQSTTQPARGPYATQLAAEADALIETAVRRGYGWAWGDVNGGAEQRISPIPVRMDQLTTPTAGLVLLWTGDLLNDDKYRQAAFQAARGIAAAVDANGRVPARAVFGRSPEGEDAMAAVPDRAPACAGLALLLILHARADVPDERTHRAMVQAANWLARQQARSGAWPAAWPADARPNDTMRIIRLDQRDYRDCTLALLMASATLENPQLDRSGARGVDYLLRLRIDQRGHVGRGLWRSIYNLDGSYPLKIPEATEDVDVLASRFAVQTLLAAYIMTGNRDWGLAANEAVKVIENLRGVDGTWQRTYGMHPSSRPATTQPEIWETWPTGWFGLDAIIRTTQELKLLGRDKYLTLLENGFPVRDHVAQVLAGLSDTSLTLGFPLSKEEIEPYLTKNAPMWQTLNGLPPADLPGRVQRLWILYLRAKIESR